MPMSELSVFIDESGDFGKYQPHSPYYIVAFVLHDQSQDIAAQIESLKQVLKNYDLPEGHAIHTAPLIRREGDYANMVLEERVRIFNALSGFARKTPFCYDCIVQEKRDLDDRLALIDALSKRIVNFLTNNQLLFKSYNQIIVYYDNGQNELTKIIVSLFNAFFENVKYRKIQQPDYRLAQIADMLCTLTNIERKAKDASWSKSEIAFFENSKSLERNYLRHLRRKRLQTLYPVPQQNAE